MMNKGKFITFEGGEGSGKTTQSKMFCQYLSKNNIEYILTREVGGTIEAEQIREIVVHADLLPISELLLIMAARAEHINKVILPALKLGKWVVCDRFIDSTAAYQGNNVTINKVYELHNNILNNFMPDITFFIDIDPDIALQRALTRGENNKFEYKGLDFHKQVYQNFVNISENYSSRVKVINGLEDVNDIHCLIKEQIDALLNKESSRT